MSFWIAFLQRLKEEELTIPPGAAEVEAIITSQVTAISAMTDAFPALPSETNYRKEPDIDSWLLVIRMCLRLNSANACSAYFKRMHDTYYKADKWEKNWIGDCFISPAIRRLAEEADTYDGMFELLAEFFKFALDVYVNRAMIEDGGQFSILTFKTAVKRSGDATFLIAKYVHVPSVFYIVKR